MLLKLCSIHYVGYTCNLIYVISVKCNKQQETKASFHQGQCMPAGSSVSLPRRVLMSIITMRTRRFPVNSAYDCLRIAKFRPQFSESCGAIYRRICEMFSALQSTSSLVTDFENRVQIADAKEKNRNIGAQLQSIRYTTAQKIFGKIYFL